MSHVYRGGGSEPVERDMARLMGEVGARWEGVRQFYLRFSLPDFRARGRSHVIASILGCTTENFVYSTDRLATLELQKNMSTTSAAPPTNAPTRSYKAAGVIPFNAQGLWLLGGKKGLLQDFGGKREPTDASPWATARREMHEEGGLRLEAYAASTFHPESKAQNVVFYCETQTPPTSAANGAPRFVAWSDVLLRGLPSDRLHPRLRFDQGGLIRAKLRELARAHAPRSAPSCALAQFGIARGN